ncbi:MAG: NB-ARC domain-containing protein [Cyanobacteria bacterium P01_F01_bin.116]
MYFSFIAICQTVGLDDWQQLVEPLPDGPEVTVPPASSVDWGDAPDVDQFYGRQPKLQQLQTWVLTDAAKQINISGPGGIGKTAMTLALTEQLQTEFSYVIWRSLATVQSLSDLLADLLDSPMTTVDRGIRQLLKKMQHRWLIVLDDVALSNSYLEMIDRLSQARHQSCLIVISLQPLSAQLQTSSRSQQLSLAGLSATAAAELLEACGCVWQGYQLKKPSPSLSP